MQEVTFTLQTITPLFLAGNDQVETKVSIDPRKQSTRINIDYYTWKLLAELRSPPFRGLMRYWQRALTGGAMPLEDVIKLESSIFGTTDTGSTVHIKISKPSKEPEDFWKEGKGREPTGKDYLLWSMARSGSIEKDNYKFPRQYYPRDTEFQVTLAVRGQGEAEQKLLNQAIVAFWLLTHLGGIGSRSRRCAGSVTATPVEGHIPSLPFKPPVNAEALREQIKQGIATGRELYDIDQRPMTGVQFDVLVKGFCRIWVLQNANNPWLSADEAMNAIGGSLQDYRSNVPPIDKISSIERRKVFGLPLPPIEYNKRRASPLLLRVSELQVGKVKHYVGIAVLFKTIGQKGYMSDYALIEDWIKTSFPVSKQMSLEVQL